MTLSSGLAFAIPAAIRAESAKSAVSGDAIIKVKIIYAVDETISRSRLKQDIAGKGIMYFSAVDQSKLAADAGIKPRASTLLMFGNPPLGTQFITSNPNAGLDWPVRLLETQDEKGDVWAVYTDFQWIAQRHGSKGIIARTPFSHSLGQKHAFWGRADSGSSTPESCRLFRCRIHQRRSC